MNVYMHMAALWVTECWYAAYRDKVDSPFPRWRRYAIYARTRAVVLHDRILNGERRGLEKA